MSDLTTFDPVAMVAAAAVKAAAEAPTIAPLAPLGHFKLAPVESAAVRAVTIPVVKEAPLAPLPVLSPVLSFDEALAVTKAQSVSFLGVDAEDSVVMHGHCTPIHFPPPALPGVTFVQVFTAIEKQASAGHWLWQNGALVSTVLTLPLELVKQRAVSQIERMAEAARLTFITNGSGQALVYQAKKEEAVRFLQTYASSTAAETAVTENWPMLGAELNITAPTLWVIAQTVNYLANSWIGAAAMIETQRLTAKNAVVTALTETAVKSILAALRWPRLDATSPTQIGG